MGAEMPAQVQPVAGATRVDFPWAEATTAVAALNEAVSTLGSQLEARATLAPSIVDWLGTYRDEFDRADGRLTTTATGLRETLAATASWIVGGAESANAEQRRRNTLAEQQPTATTTTAPPVGAGHPI
jgi:hypothetical protein